MIKWDLVIPSATFLPSSYFPQLSRKGWPVFLIWALLDLKDLVALLRFWTPLVHRRVRRAEVANGAERCLYLPQLSNELIIDAQIDKKLVYSSPFFHTRHSSTTVMGSRASWYLDQNWDSEVQKSEWSPSNYCCAYTHPATGVKLGDLT